MQTWNTQLYDGKHGFVAKYGEELLGLLDAQPGEAVLDVGCGTGHLTAKIAESGATVLGLDSSADMIAQARVNYPALLFTHTDIVAFDQPKTFDAVFSNATLHWVRDANGAARAIAAALKPGGRLVAEFGGAGNIAGIATAVQAALRDATGQDVPHNWYFPTVGEYASMLETHNLTVHAAWLFERPTPLDGADGMRNWISMFGGGLFARAANLSNDVKRQVIERAEAHLFATHFKNGQWFADYRRIRIVAVR